MARLLNTLTLLVFLCPLGQALAQNSSCRVEAITLKSKIMADPSSALIVLGDALTVNPNCVSYLMEATIQATKPNEEQLRQILKVAVDKCPKEADVIAQSAVRGMPGEVEMIRRVFKNLASGETPKVKERANPTPIEKFLLKYQTSRPHDHTDVADEALLAIDRMLADLDKASNEKKNADLVQVETSLSQRAPLSEEEFTNFQMPKIEEFRMSTSDMDLGTTTLNDPAHHDLQNELVTDLTESAPVIEDPVAKVNVASYLDRMKQQREAATREQEAMEDPKRYGPRDINSSVYHIPTANGIVNVPAPVLRSRSVSPTSPVTKLGAN